MIRFIIGEWTVNNVQPQEKETLVINKVSELIDIAWLRDTTVIDKLNSFSIENEVSFELSALADTVWVKYTLPID